jgi:hypothetical protein
MGEGAMIALLGASAIVMAAMQATITAPTEAFRNCLHDASDKATKEKVAGDAFEAYARNACSVQMGSLKSAVVAFRMKNGMSRKAAGDDAEMTVDDYVGTSVDKYQFFASQNAQSASAKPAAPAATPAAHATPAAATQPPRP